MASDIVDMQTNQCP